MEKRKRRAQRENHGQANLLQMRTFRLPRVPAASPSTQNMHHCDAPNPVGGLGGLGGLTPVNMLMAIYLLYPPSFLHVPWRGCNVYANPSQSSVMKHSPGLISPRKQYTAEEKKVMRSRKLKTSLIGSSPVCASVKHALLIELIWKSNRLRRIRVFHFAPLRLSAPDRY